MVTKEQVEQAQQKWAEGVVKIGSLKDNREACEQFTSEFLDNRYAFDKGTVLFKPTKCEHDQFRPTKEKAVSYFIAGENCECSEDGGFAIAPWSHVKFENHNLILEDNRAIAMGNYFFTTTSGDLVKVEYTFGYKLIDGTLKIDLHHSSIPYSH